MSTARRVLGRAKRALRPAPAATPSTATPAKIALPAGRTGPFHVASTEPRDVLAKKIADRTWFHRFEFDNGLIADANDPSHEKATTLGLPDRLDGLTVLDIGAFDGHFSFEAARRGAADVLATDRLVWQWPGMDPLGNLRLVREITGLPVRDQLIGVEELTPEAVGGPFDVVLFLGVLYHAPDPLGYLKKVRSVTRKYAIIETVVDVLDVPKAALAYYPGESLNGDGSNFFGPNMLALEGLLIDAGFSRVDDLGLWRVNEIEFIRGITPPAGPPSSGRTIVRAWV